MGLRVVVALSGIGVGIALIAWLFVREERSIPSATEATAPPSREPAGVEPVTAAAPIRVTAPVEIAAEVVAPPPAGPAPSEQPGCGPFHAQLRITATTIEGRPAARAHVKVELETPAPWPIGSAADSAALVELIDAFHENMDQMRRPVGAGTDDDARLDDNGRSTVDAEYPGRWRVDVWSDDGFATTSVDVAPLATADASLMLQPGVGLDIHAWASGAPMKPPGKVTIRSEGESNEREIAVDEFGVARCRGLRPGTNVRFIAETALKFRPPAGGQASGDGFEVNTARPREVVAPRDPGVVEAVRLDLEFKSLSWVKGLARDAVTGQGVAVNVRVVGIGAAGHVSFGSTPTGQFACMVESGETIRLDADGYETAYAQWDGPVPELPPVDMIATSTITEGKTRTVAGHVVVGAGSEKRGIAGIRIVVLPAGVVARMSTRVHDAPTESKTDANGAFRFERADTGPLTIDARLIGLSALAKIEAADGDVDGVELRLVPTHQVRVRVVDAITGEKVPDASIDAPRDAFTDRSCVAVPQGSTVEAIVFAPRYARKTITIDAATAPPNGVIVRLERLP